MASHHSTFNGSVHWFDDFLAEAQFQKVVDFATATAFIQADEKNKELIWAQNNRSSPYMSQNIIWPEYEVHKRFFAAVPGISTFPSGSPLDHALKAIRDASLETGVAGRLGTDWVGIISTLFRYDTNGGLIFHTDATGYSGAFTYYLNREWKSDWGGHLMFSMDDPQNVTSGEFLSPQPNRLVLMRAGVPHSISTVATPAGIGRLALSGFYVRPDRIGQIIKRYMSK